MTDESRAANVLTAAVRATRLLPGLIVRGHVEKNVGLLFWQRALSGARMGGYDLQQEALQAGAGIAWGAGYSSMREAKEAPRCSATSVGAACCCAALPMLGRPVARSA